MAKAIVPRWPFHCLGGGCLEDESELLGNQDTLLLQGDGGKALGGAVDFLVAHGLRLGTLAVRR